jgi:hypothetical protein
MFNLHGSFARRRSQNFKKFSNKSFVVIVSYSYATLRTPGLIELLYEKFKRFNTVQLKELTVAESPTLTGLIFFGV